MLAFLLALTVAASSVQSIVGAYLDRYFQTFPTKATEAGLHDRDRAIEDLSPPARDAWMRVDRDVRARLTRAMAQPGVSLDDRIDAELLLAEIDRQIHDWTVLKRPERDPLFWTSTLANATVFLLVRDDLPLAERLDRARARATLVPRLAAQAREALEATDPSLIAPDLCRIAAGQAKASAEFYRTGFPKAAGHEDAALGAAGRAAADGLSRLASFLDGLAARATGNPRLGANYAETFRLGTGIAEPVDRVLARAERDLTRRGPKPRRTDGRCGQRSCPANRRRPTTGRCCAVSSTAPPPIATATSTTMSRGGIGTCGTSSGSCGIAG